jgi:Uma2 family endonuclease
MDPTPTYPMVLELGEAHLSDTQLLALAQANAPYRLERTATQQLIFMAPSGLDISLKENLLQYYLTTWSMQTGLGVVSSPSGGFKLPNGAIRAPDAAWIEKVKLSKLSAAEIKGFAPLVPDFVAEILSTSDRLPDLQAKMEEWLANGVRLGWLIDPGTQTSWVYRPGQPAQMVQGFDQSLSGEDVLPGFVFSLNSLL